MTQERSFSEILDECLDRVARGESIAACLASYPAHATELRETLEAAAALRDAYAFTPSQDRKRASLLALHDALDRRRGRRFALWIPWPRAFGSGWSRVAATALMAVLVLGASSTGTVLAAQSSVPGDVLYPVKRTAERVELTFTFTESREVSFHTKLMERRMDELAVVAAGDRQRFVPGLVDQIERHSERAGQIAIRPVRVLVDALPEIEDPPEHPNGEGSTAVPQREVSVRPILSLHEKLERLESQAVDLEFASRDQRGRQDMKRLQEALKRVESQLGELLDRADRIHRAPTAPGSAIPTPTPAISLDVNDGRGDGQVTIEARVLDVRVRQSDGGARVELAVVVGDRSRRVLVLERGGASILRPNGTDGKLQDIRVGGVVLLTVDENGELLHVTARPGGGPPSRPTR